MLNFDYICYDVFICCFYVVIVGGIITHSNKTILLHLKNYVHVNHLILSYIFYCCMYGITMKEPLPYIMEETMLIKLFCSLDIITEDYVLVS